MYNAPLLLGGSSWRARPRPRRSRPIVRIVDRVPAAQPLPHGHDARDVHARCLHARVGRHDLGLVHATRSTNAEQFGGGFDVRAARRRRRRSGHAAAPSHARRSPPGTSRRSAASRSLPADAHQPGTAAASRTTPCAGSTTRFLAGRPSTSAALAHGYRLAGRRLAGARREPGLAVVDPDVVPRRDNFNGGPPRLPADRLLPRGRRFEPVPVTCATRRPASSSD